MKYLLAILLFMTIGFADTLTIGFPNTVNAQGGVFSGTVSANNFGTGWINGSANATVGGMTIINYKLFYSVIGKQVFVKYSLSGTGNATTTTITMPYKNNASYQSDSMADFILDSANWSSAGYATLPANSTTLTIYKSLTGAGPVNFTESGIRQIVHNFSYQID